MCGAAVHVRADADRSPAAAGRAKALTQDNPGGRGVLTHPDNTQGVSGWEGRGGRQRCERKTRSLTAGGQIGRMKVGGV